MTGIWKFLPAGGRNEKDLAYILSEGAKGQQCVRKRRGNLNFYFLDEFGSCTRQS